MKMMKHMSTNFASDIMFAIAFGLEEQNLKHLENEVVKTTLHAFNASNWKYVQTIISGNKSLIY